MCVLIRSQVNDLLSKINKDHNPNTDSSMPDKESPTIEELLTTPLSVVLQGPELQGKVFFDGHISLHSQQPPATLVSFGDSFHIHLANVTDGIFSCYYLKSLSLDVIRWHMIVG